LGITEEGEIKLLDPALDLANNGGQDNIGRFNKLREISPETKTMVAIGGWNEGSIKYSKVVSNQTIRENFVINIVTFIKKYRFNGFDIDWEYPNQRNGVQTDKQNFVLLLQNLREKFDQENLILSIAVAAFKKSASLSYIISKISKYPHFINLMTYDVHGSWDNNTGMNAPLYPGSWESNADKDLNIVSMCLRLKLLI
jgi:chitinase